MHTFIEGLIATSHVFGEHIENLFHRKRIFPIGVLATDLGTAINICRVGRIAQGHRVFGNLRLINITIKIQRQRLVVLMEAQFLSKLTGNHIA